MLLAKAIGWRPVLRLALAPAVRQTIKIAYIHQLLGLNGQSLGLTGSAACGSI